MKKNSNNQGFTLFISIVITATLLLVSMGIVNLAVREARISSAGKQSQYAFYAADTGIECALYWDVNNPTGYSAFDPNQNASRITCNQDANNSGNSYLVGGTSDGRSHFFVYFLPDPFCAEVDVVKTQTGSTTIEASGYNTCNSSDPRKVQRSVKVSY